MNAAGRSAGLRTRFQLDNFLSPAKVRAHAAHHDWLPSVRKSTNGERRGRCCHHVAVEAEPPLHPNYPGVPLLLSDHETVGPACRLDRARHSLYGGCTMHLGLIGGIGPAATVVYYQRLCARMRALGAPLELTIVQADIHTLIRNSLADLRDEQAVIYSALIQRLHAAGAECAAITSLGGHFCFEETARISALPLVSAVAPLDSYFVAAGIQRIGLLGTRIVMRTRLYGQLHRTSAVACDDDAETLGQLYQDIAVSGVCTDAQREVLFAAGRQMVAQQGADAIVLAGTDLNLAFDGQRDPGFPVIDALDVHVALLADLAAGRTALPHATTSTPQTS